VVQDVFVKVWESRAGLKEELFFNAYLFTLAHHAVVSRLRKRRVAQVYQRYVKHTASPAHNETENTIILSDLEHYSEKVIDRVEQQYGSSCPATVRNRTIAAALFYGE
jgi:DNA-directed RNA polymerase specialized sigma24 family protein